MSKLAENKVMMQAIRNIKELLRDAEQDILNDDKRNRASAIMTVSAICKCLSDLHDSESANDGETI